MKKVAGRYKDFIGGDFAVCLKERLTIELNENLDVNEFKKVIGFISEDIEGFALEGTILHLELLNNANKEDIVKDTIELSKKYVKKDNIETGIFRNDVEVKKYYSDFKCVFYFDDGLASFSGEALFLYNYFNDIFQRFVYDGFSNTDCDIVSKVYPALLPISGYKKTGYLKRSPQYSIFGCTVRENLGKLSELDKVADDNFLGMINNPGYVLSPSACFHVYQEYNGVKFDRNTIVTFTQNVCRNEGRFNFNEYGRLRDYHVREIVFLGDKDFIESSRERMLEITKQFIQEINIDAKIVIASDPFIMPRMQKFKRIQTVERSKYELLLSYDVNKYMSVASFNLHGTAFTYPFQISRNNVETVTGCIGFGLERFVLAFLSQYGEDVAFWPEQIKSSYALYLKNLKTSERCD